MKELLKNLPVIETDRLILRKFTIFDAQDMFDYASNKNVSKYVTWPVHQSIDNAKGFIDEIVNNYRKGDFPAPWAIVYKSNNKVIGTVDFVNYNDENKCAEIGYAISEDYWKKGITSEAAKAIMKVGFEQLNLNRIEALCHVDNIGSARVMQKLGMKLEGTLRQKMFVKGEYWDIHIYSILKDEYLNN